MLERKIFHPITPSVLQKLIDLARIVLIRRFPILIEGPTSSGKTSSIEYLAKRTGHHFVRINLNNHEHTDILSSYVSDPLGSDFLAFVLMTAITGMSVGKIVDLPYTNSARMAQ
jgi:midasin (ATPase involved in ribosome maturation)